MPTLRDELIPVIDEARGVMDELGLRVRRVAHVVRTWSGAEVGAGTVTEVTTELSPAPRVRQVSPRSWTSGGEVETSTLQSDQILVDKVSASYEAEWIQGSALTTSQELIYAIDGEPHQLLSAEAKPFEWRLTLARRLV